ncbi:peptide elongation factor 1 alpha [Pseudoloma neurophilia]|uniref:Peptide elongation factor 1 alpha n=1 Tax=Pseudoloma neurophilia TaxID=146866 RepID=A0A0R0LW63_9MICR|nr:peptide elongation factor 1 alpha [Pseudoloma neurophilia]
MSAEKPILNVCFIGHVDSGKSTTVGNLAYQLGAIDARSMEKLKKEAEERGRGTFSFAYVMDLSKAERDRGITITTSLMKLETSKHLLNVIDCPGHQDFIKNMVTGAAQADVGVVLVPCATGEFESCISGGTLKDHIMISGVLGCRKLIVCVNKVDTIEESKKLSRFDEVAKEMRAIISKSHPDKDPIIIPISGYLGINIIEKGEKFDWFKGWLPEKNAEGAEKIFTLEGALNSQIPPPRPIDQPLRMPIDSVHKISGIGMVYTGRVSVGTIKPGMTISCQPAGVVAECKTLEIHKETRDKVVAGENCGLALKNPTKGSANLIKPGHVFSDAKNSPCQLYKGSRAKIVIVEHPKGIKVGYCPVMDIATNHVPCQITKLYSKRIPGIKEEITAPDLVQKGENVTCMIHPQKDVVMETLKECASLARFALRDGGHIVGIGAIEQCFTPEDYDKEVPPVKAKPTRARG